MIKESDQLGLHLFEAGRDWACELNPRIAACLLEDVEGGLTPENIDQKLEEALDLEEVFDEDERKAYTQALRKIFFERLRRTKEMLSIPFAPRND